MLYTAALAWTMSSRKHKQRAVRAYIQIKLISNTVSSNYVVDFNISANLKIELTLFFYNDMYMSLLTCQDMYDNIYIYIYNLFK